MIGIAIANKDEWKAVLKKFKVNTDDCNIYPYGQYFEIELYEEKLLFYRSGVRKTNGAAATQYMIDHFNLDKVIVAGTCAGIDTKYKTLDIIFPNKLVQCDCTVKENEPLIRESYNVCINTDNYDNLKIGLLGTSDKPVVTWKDYIELRDNGITIADTESAAVAFVCKLNKVECVVIKGISDFPTNEEETSSEESLKKQYNIFLNNIPIIMDNIIDKY